MKTASWERNLNVMLNTFKNIIQMPERFSFMNLGPWGISGKNSHFLFRGKQGWNHSCKYSIIQGRFRLNAKEVRPACPDWCWVSKSK